MNRSTPTVGAWYQDTQDGHLFEIVALDEKSGTIEVQHFDGEVEEYDLETWRLLEVRTAAEPEDWSAPYEVDAADHHAIDGDIALNDWSDPFSRLEPHNLLEAIEETMDEEEF